ncbi:hypothetical protein BGZ73_006225 [Actinomortierella ambigua]|nr:hypothetical protein BGZ73_006225 [Actinomortierella ambigua]
MSSTPPPNSPRQTAMPSTCPSSSPTVAPPSLQHAYGQSDSSRQSNIESPLQVLQDGRQFLTIPLFGHEPPNDHSRYHRPQGHVPSGTSTITLIIPPEDSVDTSATDVSATLGARRSRSLYQEDACPFQITETIRPASVVSHGLKRVKIRRYLTVPGQAYVAADRQHNRVPSTSGLSISASTRSSLSAAIPESTVAYSYSSSDETISNRPRWMRRWRPSLRRGGQEREATPNSSDDEYESDHRRSPSRSRERQSRRTRRTPLPRRGTDERGGVQGIQHALRIGFLSTLGPGIPVTPTASVFGEQLADGMFNKNNPGGLFGYSREEERRLVRKIDWRLIPILGTFYSLSTLTALIPGVLIYIAMFYKRSEQTFRLAILALFNAAAGAFGGLIAGAIGLIHGAAGLDGWQWVFILEAILTATCAVAAYFILAKTPETAPWLNQRETSIAIYRIRNDTKLKVNRSFSKKTVLSAVKDPKVYIFMVLNLILTSLVASSIPGHYMSTSPSLFSWDPIFPPDNDIFAPLMKKRQAAQAAPHPPSRTQASRTRRHSLHPTNFLPPRAPPHSRMPLASPYLTASAPGPSTTIPPSTISLSITTTPEPLPSPIPEDESLFPLPAPDDTETPSSSPGQPVTGVDSAFQETTVKERILAQLMSSPPYLVGGLVTFAVALVVDRTQQRAYMIVGLALVTMSGYACELATTNSYARYAASFFIYSGQSAMVPVVTSWITTNVGAYAKRAIAVAMFQLAASLGGITGSLIYHSKGAPRHIRGHSLNICMLVMLIAFTALQRWRLWRENRRRNYSVAFGLNPIRRLSKNEIRDLGDQHPAFRYTI